MATVKVELPFGAWIPATTNGAQYSAVAGANAPVPSWAFSDTVEQAIHAKSEFFGYGSGNVTVEIIWYADTATTGNVVFGAAIAAITPETDTTDIETKAFATATEVTDGHLGTTAHRLMTATIVVTNLDSLTVGDFVFIKIYRKAADAADTLVGLVKIVDVHVHYSDV